MRSTKIKTYHGGNQETATKSFLADAKRMESKGYEVASQSWERGQWGCGAFLFALALCFVFIGVVVFIYMLIVPPQGTLTATYRASDAESVGQKICPRCAEKIKSAARVCRFCGHEPAEWS